jgi:hypothetical protein
MDSPILDCTGLLLRLELEVRQFDRATFFAFGHLSWSGWYLA